MAATSDRFDDRSAMRSATSRRRRDAGRRGRGAIGAAISWKPRSASRLPWSTAVPDAHPASRRRNRHRLGPRVAAADSSPRSCAAGRAEIVEHESPLSMLAVPLAGLERGASLVAVGVFRTMRVEREAQIMPRPRESLASTAASAGLGPRHGDMVDATSLMRLADATLENLVEPFQTGVPGARNQRGGRPRPRHLCRARPAAPTRRGGLTLSQDDGQLWRRSVQWLAESVPARMPGDRPARRRHGARAAK